MNKLLYILITALLIAATPNMANGADAQQQKRTTTAKKHTTQRKTTTTAKKRTTAKKKKTTTTQRKKQGKAKQNNAKYSTAEIRGLQSKRSGIQKEIKKQEEALRLNKADVRNASTTCLYSTARSTATSRTSTAYSATSHTSTATSTY